jgi:hypothetical protein
MRPNGKVPLTKNKYWEIDYWKDKAFGVVVTFNTGDHPGFRISLSFWWMVEFIYYDIRHADEM